MAYFPPTPQQPDFAPLFTSLANSRTQLTDNALYQTIFLLIQLVTRSRDLTVADINTINQTISAILAATLLTVNDETQTFANSRRLLAGTGISFNDATPGQRIINATASGSAGTWSELTDGDTVEAELIFANGDTIDCFIPG